MLNSLVFFSTDDKKLIFFHVRLRNKIAFVEKNENY